MVLEAGYPAPHGRGFRKVVKASILVRKKPGMDDAAFVEHYNHTHAQMAAPVLLRHNVISYTIVSPLLPIYIWLSEFTFGGFSGCGVFVLFIYSCSRIPVWSEFIIHDREEEDGEERENEVYMSTSSRT